MRLSPTGTSEVWAKPLSTGAFAVVLWARNETCTPYDDTNVHVDPTPQVFWRSLGFRGNANVEDVWTEEVVGKAIADHWPPSYELPSHIKPHAHRFVLVTPAKDASWGAMGAAHECGPWGCDVQRRVHAVWMRTHN